MSSASKLLERARMAGLASELAERLERELIDRVRPHRLPGDWRGRVNMSDDFDAPLLEDIEDSFYDPAL